MHSLQIYEHNVVSMQCPKPIETIKYVTICPRNEFEQSIRGAIFNCSCVNNTHANFHYHCVLDEYGNKLIEVCAPSKYIQGK